MPLSGWILLQVLSIELKHVLAVQDLPLHHSDPFDRLLIAQARVENAQLVTADGQIEQYADQVNVLW
ncbi:MAG TPA: PIN domain-containing protein [Gammaproteobacteria bacterium]|nr:PIN domain-containing protein [Gammaproteobacteria bacterium]